MENEKRKVSISGQCVCKRAFLSLWGLISVTPPTTLTTTEHPTLILTSDLKPGSWPSNSPKLVAGEVPGYSQCCQGALEQGAELPDCSEYLSTLTPLYHGFCFFFIVFHTLKNNPLKLWDLKCPITHTHTHVPLSPLKVPQHIHSFTHPTEGLHGQLFHQNKSPETGREQRRRMRGTGNVLSISVWGSVRSTKLKQEIAWMEKTGLFLRGLWCGPRTKGSKFHRRCIKSNIWGLIFCTWRPVHHGCESWLLYLCCRLIHWLF